MKKQNIFPLQLLEFEYPSLLSWREMDIFLTSHYRMANMSIGQTHSHLHREPYLHSLVSWFRECIEEARKEFDYNCEALEITTCWANVAWMGSAGMHHLHDHPWSTLSGVFYASAEGSPTVFHHPWYSARLNRCEPSRNFDPHAIHKVPFSPGKLILFQSGLMHETMPWEGEENRWSISFNTLPSGNFNHYEHGLELTSAHISISN